MSQAATKQVESREPEAATSSVTTAPQLASNGSVGATQTATPERDNLTGKYEQPAPYFLVALDSAERLLAYSSETGVNVDDATRNSILEARAAGTQGWTRKIASNLLAGLGKIAAQVKPVTAESLKACSAQENRTVRTYWIVAISLAIFIVPVSVATFVTSGIADAIRKDIITANELAVKLGSQLGPSEVSRSTTLAPNDNDGSGSPSSLPPGLSRVDVITELQSFAATMRAIDTRGRQLNWLIFHAQKDPFLELRSDPVKIKEKLQLKVPLPANLAVAANDRIAVYQDVRSFAQGVVDSVSVFYGAITVCILPVLYALLGTCAYLLRSFERDMSNRTFVPSHADSPRFLIAGIGGAVVGLFNNFAITQGASIPPLAIAFLVGYAVDVFFSFLEGLIQAFTKDKTSSTISSPSTATRRSPELEAAK